MQSITIRARGQPSLVVRAVYLILGAFFACLTARVLLWEVHGFSDLTSDHLFTIGAVVGAIASGIYFGHMLRQLRLIVAAGLGIAFVVATAYCLIGSAGRGDELAFEKNAAARQVNKDRERVQRSRDEARRRYDAALDAEAAECSGGAGTKCLGKRAVTQDRRSDLEVAELLLQQAKPEQRENGKLKRAAQVIALFTSATEESAERGLAILWPFLPPFICELLTITFLHLGFGHRGHKKSSEFVTEKRPASAATVQQQFSERQPLLATPNTDIEAVRGALRKVCRPVTNDELAALMGVTKGEASRRASVACDHGSATRQRFGKFVAISLPEQRIH